MKFGMGSVIGAIAGIIGGIVGVYRSIGSEQIGKLAGTLTAAFLKWLVS